MNARETFFAEERASVLAVVFLTRSPDIVVSREVLVDGHRLDLLVSISRNAHSNREFAVEVEGTLSSEAGRPGFWDKVNSKKGGAGWNKVRMPVYLFLFFADTDEGFYAPLNEAANHSPNTAPEFKRLDSEALDAIIDQVNSWYDSLVQAS